MRSMKFAKCYKCKVSVGHIAFKRFLLLSLSRLTFSPFCFHERKIAPSVSRSFPSTHPSLLLSLESTPIPISESSFLSLSLSLFRAALGWSLFTLHCSFSLSNLAHPFLSYAPTSLPIFFLSLSRWCSRSLRAPLVLVNHALMRSYSLSAAQRASHSTDSRDRRSLQLLQSTPSRHARWLKFLFGFELSHCALSCRVPSRRSFFAK